MRILVTGAAGFIGKHLCRRLRVDGHDVLETDNGWRYGEQGTFPTDVTSFEQVSTTVMLSKPDAVIHLAAINGTKNFYEKPSLVLEVGLKGALSVVEACERHGVEKLFVASSSEVYQAAQEKADEQVPFSCPDPLNPRYSYAVSKMATEMVALHSKVKHVVIFRPHNVYGPAAGMDHVVPQFIERARKLRPGQPFEVRGDAGQTRAFTYIDDFITALSLLLAAGKDREIYHIGTEEEVTIVDLARRVFQLVRPGEEFTPVFGDGVVGGPDRRCPDIRKMAALGWSPKVFLEEGLRKTVEAYK